MRSVPQRIVRRVALSIPRRARGDIAGMWLTPAARGYHTGDYEPTVVSALRRLVVPGSACADVGAHLGYMSLLLARLTGPDGRVVAFEASPRNARTVARNIRLNRLGDRVRLVQTAVADGSAASVDIFPRHGASAEWTVYADYAQRGEPQPGVLDGVTVPATSLDAEFADDRLDLVKIDVEGAEGLVVAGMSRLLRRDRPIIVLEFHRPLGWDAVVQLREAGYRFETLEGADLRSFATPDDVPYQLIARAE
jgi:FkbM family methyltransferase